MLLEIRHDILEKSMTGYGLRRNHEARHVFSSSCVWICIYIYGICGLRHPRWENENGGKG